MVSMKESEGNAFLLLLSCVLIIEADLVIGYGHGLCCSGGDFTCWTSDYISVGATSSKNGADWCNNISLLSYDFMESEAGQGNEKAA